MAAFVFVFCVCLLLSLKYPDRFSPDPLASHPPPGFTSVNPKATPCFVRPCFRFFRMYQLCHTRSSSSQFGSVQSTQWFVEAGAPVAFPDGLSPLLSLSRSLSGLKNHNIRNHINRVSLDLFGWWGCSTQKGGRQRCRHAMPTKANPPNAPPLYPSSYYPHTYFSITTGLPLLKTNKPPQKGGGHPTSQHTTKPQPITCPGRARRPRPSRPRRRAWR